MALWAGILAPERAVDWAACGVIGGIPTNRVQYGTTIPAGSSLATINTRISQCAAAGGGIVQLGSGTFTFAGGIIGVSGVTLKGAGASSTIINADVSSAGGYWSSVVVMGVGNTGKYPQYTGSFTATNYGQGANQITVSSTTGMAVGGLLFLDMADPTYASNPPDIVCAATNSLSGGFCLDGEGDWCRASRNQLQAVRITGINGSLITFTPGFYLPNWGDRSTGLYWGDNVLDGFGIEDLTINHAAGGSGTYGVTFYNAKNCWLKNVRSLYGNRSHVMIRNSVNCNVVNSYFYSTQNAADQSYGIEAQASADCLIENNIFQHISAPCMLNGDCQGFVWSYNYAFDLYYTISAGWCQPSNMAHATCNMALLEGNVGPQFYGDVFHGTHNMLTAFRNKWDGHDTDARTGNAIPVRMDAYSRYFNLVGNVLGRLNWSNGYESGTRPIYSIGGGNSNANGVVYADAVTNSTLMRWGNYDRWNNAVRWVPGENGQNAYRFPALASPSQTLPPSFYRSSNRPAFFTVNGIAVAWPPIGPEVTGGDNDSPSVGGRAYLIPAQRVYALCSPDMNYPVDPSGYRPILFNPTYYGTTEGGSPPAAPTGFHIVP